MTVRPHASRLAVSVLAAALLSAGAAAGEPVVLKEHLVTEDHVVTLSDLFETERAEADAPLARIAEPGGTLPLEPDYVRRAAARAGLDWANAGGVLRVTVTRDGRAVHAPDIAAIIEGALYAESGRAHEITLSNRSLTLYAPVDAAGAPELISLETEPRSAMFRAEIAAWPGGEAHTVTGRAEAVADLPVLTRPVARGEVITDDMIEWTRLPEARVRGDVLRSAEALVGLEAKRSLRPGEAVRAYDVEAPAAIERGETVALVYAVGALTLTARARALSDAALGETARFMNLQSNRTVEAVVEAPGRARVRAFAPNPS